ncbi:nijmegen breakage syndrome protein 1 [Angomonas deanei]|uniref:Uncharacterized protein n=1 Tax=Angomonas deanei TaxID=59799 RepID=A0A7G2C4F2_9TRYP|nr:nijmegen breakage syndrome protein 1 [Angomonas deanei]CAD2213613.1 hypothetical protein, conserved [Angomonas deanei]|eukprot:EPY17603.1 nijmegen breakage syndrome protein 1 [Angomonas deanei]
MNGSMMGMNSTFQMGSMYNVNRPPSVYGMGSMGRLPSVGPDFMMVNIPGGTGYSSMYRLPSTSSFRRGSQPSSQEDRSCASAIIEDDSDSGESEELDTCEEPKVQEEEVPVKPPAPSKKQVPPPRPTETRTSETPKKKSPVQAPSPKPASPPPIAISPTVAVKSRGPTYDNVSAHSAKRKEDTKSATTYPPVHEKPQKTGSVVTAPDVMEKERQAQCIPKSPVKSPESSLDNYIVKFESVAKVGQKKQKDVVTKTSDDRSPGTRSGLSTGTMRETLSSPQTPPPPRTTKNTPAEAPAKQQATKRVPPAPPAATSKVPPTAKPGPSDKTKSVFPVSPEAKKKNVGFANNKNPNDSLSSEVTISNINGDREITTQYGTNVNTIVINNSGNSKVVARGGRVRVDGKQFHVTETHTDNLPFDLSKSKFLQHLTEQVHCGHGASVISLCGDNNPQNIACTEGIVIEVTSNIIKRLQCAVKKRRRSSSPPSPPPRSRLQPDDQQGNGKRCTVLLLRTYRGKVWVEPHYWSYALRVDTRENFQGCRCP